MKNSVKFSRILNIPTESIIWLHQRDQLSQILKKTFTFISFQEDSITISGNDEDLVRIAQNSIESISLREYELVFLRRDNQNSFSYKPYMELLNSQKFQQLQEKNPCIFLMTIDQLIEELKYLTQETGYSKQFSFQIEQYMVLFWVPKKEKGQIILRKIKQMLDLSKDIYQSNITSKQNSYRYLQYLEFLLFCIEYPHETLLILQKDNFNIFDDGTQIIIEINDEINIQKNNFQSTYISKLLQNLHQCLTEKQLYLIPIELNFSEFKQFYLDVIQILRKNVTSYVQLFSLTQMKTKAQELDYKYKLNILQYLTDLGYMECFFILKNHNDQDIINYINYIIDLRLKYNKYQQDKQNQLMLQKKLEKEQRKKELQLKENNNSLIITYENNRQTSQFNLEDFQDYLHLSGLNQKIDVNLNDSSLQFTVNNQDKKHQVLDILSDYMNNKLLIIQDYKQMPKITQIQSICDQFDCNIDIFRSQTNIRGVVEIDEHRGLTQCLDGTALVFIIENLIHSKRNQLIEFLLSKSFELEITSLCNEIKNQIKPKYKFSLQSIENFQEVQEIQSPYLYKIMTKERILFEQEFYQILTYKSKQIIRKFNTSSFILFNYQQFHKYSQNLIFLKNIIFSKQYLLILIFLQLNLVQHYIFNKRLLFQIILLKINTPQNLNQFLSHQQNISKNDLCEIGQLKQRIIMKKLKMIA